jgi:hypothetical protein
VANSLGALTVLLGLDASEYVRGLNKAEVQAKQFAANTRTAMLEVGKVLGGLEIGRVLLENTRAIVEEASALQNLAGSLGTSVESLSRLNNQAKIAGTDFTTLQNAALKLANGMAGADEESTKVKDALKILGVTTKDPVQALEEVSVKLNTYADGVNKVGLASALFGAKQGPQFLSTLKDIAELQDVGATITAKQAAESQSLEQAMRRLGVESEGFKNILLSSLVPALRDMISQFSEGIKVAGGFGQALRLLGQIDTGDLAGETTRIAAAIEHAQEVIARNKALFGNGDLFGGDKAVANLQTQLRFVQSLARARGLASIDPSNNDARDFLAQRKPEAPNPPSAGGKGGTKERTSDAQRYLETLEKQYQTTLELNAVDEANAHIYELQQSSLSGLSDEIKKIILDYATQIDAAKEAKKAAEDQARAEQEASRIRERNSQAVTRQIETAQRDAQSLRDGNEQLREELIGLRDGEAALNAYISAKLLKAAAEKDDEAAMLANAGASQQLIDATKANATALRERNQLLADKTAAQQLQKDAQAMQQFAGAISDAFANSFEGFIMGTKSAKAAFKDFATSIQQILVHSALKNLGDRLLGNASGTGGSSIWDVLSNKLGSFDWSSLFSSGSPGATGGTPDSSGLGGLGYAAAGTSWSHAGSYMVGENGPEILNLPSGARVTPKNYSSARNSGGVQITQHINVMPGASTASSRQAAGMLRDATMSAVRDR